MEIYKLSSNSVGYLLIMTLMEMVLSMMPKSWPEIKLNKPLFL